MEPTACLLLRLFEKHHALQSPFSPSSLLQLFWNIREFGAKNILHTIKQLIQLVIWCYKRKYFWSILFFE